MERSIVLPAWHMRLTVCLCLLLAGCASRQDQMTADRQTCLAIGFTIDTPEFRNCVLQLQVTRLGARLSAPEPVYVPMPMIIPKVKP